MPNSEPTKKGRQRSQKTEMHIGEKTRFPNKQHNTVRNWKKKGRPELGRRASCDALSGAVAPVEKKPVWKEESELDVLDWEMFQLDGWDRLWPLVGN